MELLLKVTPTGSAGSAGGSASSDFPVWGFIDYVTVTYTSQPSTTDVTVAEAGGLARNLVALTNNNTNKVAYPRVQATDSAASAITGVYDRPFVNGQRITLTVAQGDPVADGVVVRVGVIPGGPNAS